MYAKGLSPRMRGYRLLPAHPLGARGSIPAYAGLPVGLPMRSTTSWVYPRVCGATEMQEADGTPSEGLSPRMRGYPLRCLFCVREKGSIPAYAGLPRLI